MLEVVLLLVSRGFRQQSLEINDEVGVSVATSICLASPLITCIYDSRTQFNDPLHLHRDKGISEEGDGYSVRGWIWLTRRFEVSILSLSLFHISKHREIHDAKAANFNQG